MKELLRIAAALRADSRPAVLATLVKTAGSSYRRTGARLLLTAAHTRIGSISGGCLEEDIAAHASAVLSSGQPRTLVYDTTDENDLVWGAGLGCHGIVHVLLEPVAGLPPALAFVLDAWSRREAAVLLTAFDDTGPANIETSPANRSAAPSPRLLRGGPLFALAENNATWIFPALSDTTAASSSQLTPSSPPPGTAFLHELAKKTLGTAASSSQTHSPLSAFPAPHSTNAANTSAALFAEYLPPPPALAIFGAGDDAQPLVRLAAELGWLVTVVDSRAAFATPARFPEAAAVRLASPADAVAAASLDARSFAVVMTHRYLDDAPILRDLLPRPLAYVGLLGPKKRAEKILADLARDGLHLTPAMRARLHAPVGLDLGGGTPEEVALAILAEIQAFHSARDARPLRERGKPIHHE